MRSSSWIMLSAKRAKEERFVREAGKKEGRSCPLWNAPPTAALWLMPNNDGPLYVPHAGKAASGPPQSIKEQIAHQLMRHS
jgi:hypothetical protein